MWRHKEDNTDPIITAKKHVVRSHRSEKRISLPPKAVLFCMGVAMEYLKKNYKTNLIMRSIPKFISSSECLAIERHQDVCFVHGGFCLIIRM